MELTKEQQAYLDICEENGWSYSIDEKYNEVELSQSSPAGEDFSFIVSLEDLPAKVHSFIFNFDVDEHVDMWIEARRAGVEGVPTTRELVDDAEAIEQMLEDLSRVLLDHKKGQKLTIDDPADSLAVMERLVNPKADAPTNEVSVDDLVAQIKEKDGIVFADYWTRDEIVNRLAFEGVELDPSNFEKVIEYAQDILSDHDMDLEEITRYARSFAPKETKAKEASPKRISPKADLAMGREAASQSPLNHNRNIGRSR